MKTILKIILLLLLIPAVKIYAQTAEEFYDKALKLEEAGNYNAALSEIDKGLLQDPANQGLNLAKVQLLYNSGSKQQALGLIESFVEVNRDDELLATTYSTILYNMGDKQKALTVLEDFLKQHKSKDVYISLSSMYEEEKQFDKAATAFAPLAEMLADNPKAQVRYTDLLMLAGRAADAEKVLHNALKKEPDNQYLQFQLANAYVEQKRYAETLTTLNALIAKYPTEEYYKGRAVCYRILNQDDKAYADCLAMLKINECNFDAFGFIIEYEFRTHKFTAVIEHSAKAVVCDPDAEALLLPFLFPSYYFTGQDVKGEVVLDKFLATNPAGAAPYYVKGAALIKQQKYKEALPFLEKSLAMPDITQEEAVVINSMRVGVWLVTEHYDALADYSDSLAKTAAASGDKAAPKLPGDFSLNPNGTSTKASVTVTFDQQNTQVFCTVSVPVDTVNMLKERYGIRLF